MSTTNKNKLTVIGSATLEYDENGRLETASFFPKVNVDYSEIKQQLGNCSNKSIDEIKSSAELLLASFFNKLNDVELRDMEVTTLEAVVSKNEKHSNGTFKHVEIDFIYGE